MKNEELIPIKELMRIINKSESTTKRLLEKFEGIHPGSRIIIGNRIFIQSERLNSFIQNHSFKTIHQKNERIVNEEKNELLGILKEEIKEKNNQIQVLSNTISELTESNQQQNKLLANLQMQLQNSLLLPGEKNNKHNQFLLWILVFLTICILAIVIFFVMK
jgi:hypothetical protein